MSLDVYVRTYIHTCNKIPSERTYIHTYIHYIEKSHIALLRTCMCEYPAGDGLCQYRRLKGVGDRR